MEIPEHSDRFKQMAANTERFGMLENPDGYGIKRGDCGDIVEVYLSVEAGQVSLVTFQIAGCLNTYACANTLSFLAEGRPVTECWEISPEHIIEYLETLPEDHHHCAELVVGTFYLALNNYSQKPGEPGREAHQALS